MADLYTITVTITKNGTPLPGFDPLIRRFTCDESQALDTERDTGGGYVTLPTTELATLQLLALTSTQQATLRLDGQSDAGLVINAGGLVLLANVTIDAGPSTNATVENNSGSTTLLRGAAAGT